MEITFDKYQKLCHNILEQVNKEKYDGILCILKGGVFLADFLQRKLLLPVFYAEISSYDTENNQKILTFQNLPELKKGNYLVVDDIYDTGNTIKFIKKHYWECFLDTCVLISRIKGPDIVGERIFHNNWVNFWWEKL
jgi:hypothetical protein